MNELQLVSERDQRVAAVADVSRSVARHYAELIDAGMTPRYAIALCREMQNQWLQSVLPPSELVREMMLRDEGGDL